MTPKNWKRPETSLSLNSLPCRIPKKGAEAFLQLRREDAGVRELRTARYLMEQALEKNEEEVVHHLAKRLLTLPISTEDRIAIDAMRIWAYLQKDEWQKAEEIFETYPMELLNQESTLLYTLYGCWLLITEGEEITTIHFSGVIDPFSQDPGLYWHMN